jgi:hypothetical protein
MPSTRVFLSSTRMSKSWWRTTAYATASRSSTVENGPTQYIYRDPLFTKSLTYRALAFEIGYGFLIWTRLRRWVILAALGFHGLLIVFTNVHLFSETMILMLATYNWSSVRLKEALEPLRPRSTTVCKVNFYRHKYTPTAVV